MNKMHNFSKSLIASVLGLSCIGAANAAVNGSIHTTSVNGVNGTTIDSYNVTLAQNGILEVDMLANESFTGTLNVHPLGLIDLNGDGEYTVLDGHMRLFKGALEVGISDDSAAYSAPGDSNGWADGSISSRDSYMLLALNAGTYTLAVGDYNMTFADVTAGFNSGDTLNNGTNHADYRLTINGYDSYSFDDNGSPVVGNLINVTVSPIPEPEIALLFIPGLLSISALKKRRLKATLSYA